LGFMTTTTTAAVVSCVEMYLLSVAT
jgi:hypothetical protein